MVPCACLIVEDLQLQAFAGDAGKKMEFPVEPLLIRAIPYSNLLSVRQKAHPYAVGLSPGNAEREKLTIPRSEFRRKGSTDSPVSQRGMKAGQETRACTPDNRRLALIVLASTVVGYGIALATPIIETILEMAEKPITDPELGVVRHQVGPRIGWMGESVHVQQVPAGKTLDSPVMVTGIEWHPQVVADLHQVSLTARSPDPSSDRGAYLDIDTSFFEVSGRRSAIMGHDTRMVRMHGGIACYGRIRESVFVDDRQIREIV